MHRVVSFDLDGTLIHGSAGAALAQITRALADGDPDEGGRILDDVMAEHRRLLAADDPVAAYDWETLVRVRAVERGRPVPFDLVARVGELACSGAARPENGTTREELEGLRRAGWRVVVLTNGWLRFQEPILRALGLWDAFDDVITADRVGHAKPAPQMFAAARGGAELHVHVGDRYDHDIAGGDAAGATTVLLRSTTPVVGPLAGPGAVDRAVVDGYLDGLARAEVEASGVADAPPRRSSPAYVARTLPEVVGFLESGPHAGPEASVSPGTDAGCG